MAASLAFDSHCHLDLLDVPVPQVLAEARAAGIKHVVTVGYDLASSRWAARCAAEHAGVYAAVAIHPNETGRAAGHAPGEPVPAEPVRAAGIPAEAVRVEPVRAEAVRAEAVPAEAVRADGVPPEAVPAEPVPAAAVLAEIAALAALPQVRAVGETGLDYYRDWSDRDVQRQWFRAHIALARQAGKALVIHDRDAHGDVLAILAEQGAPERVVFHCFSGDEDMVGACADAGYFMSFAGNVTFTSAGPLRAAARAVPLDLLLVETDAPFLTPVPYRGRPNAPALIPYTLRCLAEVRGMDAGELGTAVLTNGERVFGRFCDRG